MVLPEATDLILELATPAADAPAALKNDISVPFPSASLALLSIINFAPMAPLEPSAI